MPRFNLDADPGDSIHPGFRYHSDVDEDLDDLGFEDDDLDDIYDIDDDDEDDDWDDDEDDDWGEDDDDLDDEE